MPIYYRALVGEEYLRRWKTGYFHSSHFGAPSEWYQKWKDTNSQNPLDYPTSCSNGVYTLRAKEYFISAINEIGFGKIWPIGILEIVGELDGICAFETPLEAYKYGRESDPGKDNKDFYVEFEGEYLGKAPEYKGVVAKVIKYDEIIYSNNEFRKKYNLKTISYF